MTAPEGFDPGKPLFIGPYEVGVQQNLKPFMLPESAFPQLENALVFRGRVQRKNGYSLLGRLRLQARGRNTAAGFFTLSAGANGASHNVPNLLNDAGVGLAAVFPDARLAPGTVTITVDPGGASQIIFTDPAADGVLVGAPVGAPPPGNVGTINYATGEVNLTFNPNLAGPFAVRAVFYVYVNKPVMGIGTRFKKTTTQEETFFFDQTYCYKYSSPNFVEVPSSFPTEWSGDDTQYFWMTSYLQDTSGDELFWATNNNSTFKAANVTLFGAAAGSTIQVTAAGNTFALGDVVTFVGLAGAGSANNSRSGVVTTAGAPVFTITDPTGGTYTNGAITIGSAVSGDGIRFYQQAATPYVATATTWVNLYPTLNAPSAAPVLNPRVVGSCLLMIPYKNRLVLLNTWEIPDTSTGASVNYAQRARWSGNGLALNAATGWVDTQIGAGGYVDAPTSESIVSCGFVKDNLIVYFEFSTWQLLYTGNEILPFVWQRISSDLGCDSTKSAVLFDHGLLAMGNVGVHICNGQEVERIDAVIPDTVYDIKNNITGPDRTCAVRDYIMECVYFAYASSTPTTSDAANKYFPNRILCYNYRNRSFSFFDDNATAFGTFQATSGLTWSALTTSQYSPWASWQSPWNSGTLQAGLPTIVFGNQQGFVNQIEYASTSNGVSRYVSGIVVDPVDATGAMITSPNHNLSVGQYVTISGCLGVNVSGTFKVVRLGGVAGVNQATQFAIGPLPAAFAGTYAGGGVYSVLSNVNLQTKMFTPYWQAGKRFNLKRIDFLFDRTPAGQLQVDIYNDFSSGESMTISGSAMGLPIVATYAESATLPYYSFQSLGEQIWKRFYTWSTGETFQIQLSMNDAQMRDAAINVNDVVLHGMILHFDQAGEFF